MCDTHCHVQFTNFKEDADEVIKRALDKKIQMIVVGSQSTTSKRAVLYANKYETGVFAAVGLHPVHLIEQEVDEEEMNFVSRQEKFDYEFYKNLAQDKKVVGIGEVGVEYFHRPEDLTKEEVKKIQSQNFIEHCRLADEMNLPVIVHCRDAHADQLELIKQIIAKGGLKNRGVVHCFTGNWQEAKAYLDLGFFIGFTGVITFPPKKTNPQPSLDLLEVVQKIPLDRLLVETDSPYLAPPPHRGERNEPAYVEFVAQKVAEIKNLPLETVLEQTFRNTKALFKI